MKEAVDLPAIIFRPAIVFSIWKDGIPGWLDAFQGGAALIALVRFGFLLGLLEKIIS